MARTWTFCPCGCHLFHQVLNSKKQILAPLSMTYFSLSTTGMGWDIMKVLESPFIGNTQLVPPLSLTPFVNDTHLTPPLWWWHYFRHILTFCFKIQALLLTPPLSMTHFPWFLTPLPVDDAFALSTTRDGEVINSGKLICPLDWFVSRYS